MRVCTNVTALARRLGIRRKWLYHWKHQAERQRGEPAASARPSPQDSEIQRLRAHIAELEQTVGQQTMEIRFFKNALHRFEEIRRRK
jgi:transposase-like protein